MEILDNVKIVDLCLFLKNKKVLVVGDIHMGFDEALNKQGVLVPRHQHIETLNRLEDILSKLKIDTIIINGDLKHEFGNISETEWRHTLKILDLMSKHCKNIILIKGNHDTILGPIAKKRDLEVKEYHLIDDIYFCHGDVIPTGSEFKKCKTIVIGHEHPAINLRSGARIETFKCFLKGKFKQKNLIVMPSFNLVVEGTDILKEELLSPFLHQRLDNFNVYIVSDKIYDFGKLKMLKKEFKED